MPTIAPRTARARLAGVALGLVTATALTALTACTSGSPATTAPAARVAVPGTTPPPGTSGSDVDPGPSVPGPQAPGPQAPSTSSTAPPTGTAGPTRTPATGGSTGTSGPAACQASQVTVRVEAVEGGGAAGSQELRLRATNTGTAPCATQGYPGVSLVAPGTGRQLGAPADRTAAGAAPSGPVVRLDPGRSAVAQIMVGRADNYGAGCAPTQAAGFRVYLPGATAAAYAPYAIDACSAASVHQLRVQPLTG